MIRKASIQDLDQVADLMISQLSKEPYNDNTKKEAVLKSLKHYFNIGVILVNEDISGVLVYHIDQFWEGKHVTMKT